MIRESESTSMFLIFFRQQSMSKDVIDFFKETLKYCKNVLDVDCQTEGRLKLMIELYVSDIFQVKSIQKSKNHHLLL
jgi:hypothetical protein